MQVELIKYYEIKSAANLRIGDTVAQIGYSDNPFRIKKIPAGGITSFSIISLKNGDIFSVSSHFLEKECVGIVSKPPGHKLTDIFRKG